MNNNNLKKLRTKHNLTQEQLSSIIGIKQNTLSYWERGIYDIDNDALITLAKYFNCTTDYILGKEEKSSIFTSNPPATLPLNAEQPLLNEYIIGETTNQNIYEPLMLAAPNPLADEFNTEPVIHVACSPKEEGEKGKPVDGEGIAQNTDQC